MKRYRIEMRNLHHYVLRRQVLGDGGDGGLGPISSVEGPYVRN